MTWESERKMRGLVMGRPVGRLSCLWWVVVAVAFLGQQGWAAGVARTVVSDVVYRADGSPAKGTLLISWPAFSTANGEAVAAGQMSAQIVAGGAVSIPLIPNTGSTPKSSYHVTLKLDDGTTSEEYWTVPNAGTTTIAAIRSKVAPAAVAQQFVGRDYVDTAVAQAGSVIVDQANTFTQPQTIHDLITKNTPVIDVRAYGANGVAGVDNTAALQSAINAAVESQASLYLPCGVYEVKSMLAVYASPAPGIVGGNASCTRIRYTGTADVEHTVKFASDASATNYIQGGTIAGVTIEGNSHVTVSALGLYRPNTLALRDVWLGPANPVTGACLYVKSGVGNVYENVSCNEGNFGQWATVHPYYGLVFDGYAQGDQSTTSVVINPVIQGVVGTGLWLKTYTNAFALSGCQIAHNGQAAQVDGSMHTFDACLFELSSSGKSLEVSGGYNSFRQPFFSEAPPTQLSVTGKNVKFEGGLATLDVVVQTSARNVTFDGTVMSAGHITDLAPDTRFDNIGDSQAGGGMLVNFPAHKQSPPNNGPGQGTFDTVVHAQGTWSASDTSSTAIFPNTFATGKAWRAYFTGQVLVAGVAGGQPRFFELTDASNAIATFGANTISFAVNAATGKFTMSSTAAWQGFSGDIVFVPLPTVNAGTEQGVSLQLVGTMKAAKVATTSGAYATTLQAGTLGANNTLTLPTGADTLVGKATTDTLTNKTFDTAGSGNVLKINGAQVSAVTGTGSAVLNTSPSFSGTAYIGTISSDSSSNLYLTSSASHDAKFLSGTGGTTFIGGNGSSGTLVLDPANTFRPGFAGGVQLGSSTNPWSNLYAGTSATNNFHFGYTLTAARTITIPDANITVSGATAYSCGTTSACANTNNSATAHMVYGTVALVSGTATVTGISPAFASTSSFVCTGTNQSGTAAVKIVNASASSITITGTGTDVVGYHCVGV